MPILLRSRKQSTIVRAGLLRDENDDKLVSIFEEYADGGLAVLKEWITETPTDPDGDRAILVALQKHGFLSVKNESAESVVADVEF